MKFDNHNIVSSNSFKSDATFKKYSTTLFFFVSSLLTVAIFDSRLIEICLLHLLLTFLFDRLLMVKVVNYILNFVVDLKTL